MTTMLMGRLAGVALELALAALLVLFLPAYYVYRLTASFLGSVFPDSVSGKVVLITGASSGIGEHLAYEYAKRGANLALVARREASLQEVADNASALGSPSVLVLPADVSKPADCRKFIDDTVAYFGRLDHLVNNASIWQVCKFEEVEDVNYFRTLMDINFWGHVYPTRYAIPHLKKTHGRIVGVTSNSYIFIGRNTFYNASKAAALNFYETLRMELSGDVRITEIVPGVVESEITKGKMLTKEGEMKVDQDERDAILGPTPAEPVAAFAKTAMRDVWRGERYVFEPRWYMAVYLFRVCFPEILAWTSRLLTVKTLGRPATTDTVGRQILDMPGVRWFTQTASLRSPEIGAR